MGQCTWTQAVGSWKEQAVLWICLAIPTAQHLKCIGKQGFPVPLPKEGPQLNLDATLPCSEGDISGFCPYTKKTFFRKKIS